ncbi:hypothetical protein BC828DRAFT_337138, partial [Blastocladiella britannica]
GPGSATFIARTARRVYIGNLPRDVTEADVLAHVNREMVRNGMEPSALTAAFGGDRSFAFVEFKEVADAAKMLTFDNQWTYSGQVLRMKRPRDYMPQLAGEDGPPNPYGPQNPHKLFIGGIPRHLTIEQVRELIEAFGPLRSFHLIMDLEKNESKGYAFAEFENDLNADVAIEGLHGMEIGDRKLAVQRATIGSKREPFGAAAFAGGAADLPSGGAVGGTSGAAPGGLFGSTIPFAGTEGNPSRVLLLLNLAYAEELSYQHDYDEFIADVRDECSKFGQVLQVVVPRLQSTSLPPVVQAFVVFGDATQCANAMRNLAGRSYHGRTAIAAYFPE